jgi:hypothetical protein
MDKILPLKDLRVKINKQVNAIRAIVKQFLELDNIEAAKGILWLWYLSA